MVLRKYLNEIPVPIGWKNPDPRVMKPIPNRWKPKEESVYGTYDRQADKLISIESVTPRRIIRRSKYIDKLQDSSPLCTPRRFEHRPSDYRDVRQPLESKHRLPVRQNKPTPSGQKQSLKIQSLKNAPSSRKSRGDTRSTSNETLSQDEEERLISERERGTGEKSRGKGEKVKGGGERRREEECTRVVEGGSPRRVRFDLSVHVRPRTRSHRSPTSSAPESRFSSADCRFVAANSKVVAAGCRVAAADSRTAIGTVALLQAARENEEANLYQALAGLGPDSEDVNTSDNTGRTTVSYVASNGNVEVLELLLQNPRLDINKPDNEGNTPLHFAAQAGQVESINFIITKCHDVEIDARNDLGFTPLMKAAIQGRTKCAKLLLVAGASPTMRDTGRGLRAEQWARFCGRYVCADVIEKLARSKLLERSTHVGKWGSETDLVPHLVNGKLQPPAISFYQTQCHSGGLKNKLKKAFRTSSNPLSNDSFSLVTQLTSAALCASSPVLPGQTPPVVKSLIRPLTVPKVQVTQVPDPPPPAGSGKQKKKK